MKQQAAGDSNALEMPAKRKISKAPAVKKSNAKISKSMQRKLKKIQEEKGKREMRMQALETLEKHKLSDDVQALICSSSTLGKPETMREKLRRGMKLKSAGLEVSSDIPLIRERNVIAEDGLDETEDIVELSKLSKITESSAKKKNREANNKPSAVLPLGDRSITSTLMTMPVSTEAENVEESKVSVSGSEPVTAPSPAVTQTSQRDDAGKPKFFVSVWRTEDVEKTRRNLPIVMMEQEIMEALQENDAVIICGETGCGKTTQVPQFLYEAGFGSQQRKDRSGMVGVTQPRRIAVLATAKRVAHELNLQLGREVGFQVRHDRQVGDKSCIKFMTDGILLREIQSDFLLRNYSVIVLDEAHERSVNTDILIGMLSRVLPLRNKLYQGTRKSQQRRSDFVTPLKLVIMSATLRVEDFTANERMFPKPPPVVRVSARQFPVTIHSSRKTELLDYESAAYRKVCAIHRKLPPGGVLVFVTGRREVEALCKRLRLSFAQKITKPSAKQDPKGGLSESVFGYLNMDTLADAIDENEIPQSSDSEDDDRMYETDSSSSGVSDIEESEVNGDASTTAARIKDGPRKPGPAHVLPLYAMLPAAAQLRVFAAVPEGQRLIVVATNVAETSITIPGIRYVVDCGRAKERKFYGSSGVSKFEVCWISKASADQRAGRAGRTGPGHCYQLYSRTHYHNNFPDFAPPEISLVPMEGVVLMLKCMSIDKVMNFPFPTPPQWEALVDAEKCLTALSALDRVTGFPTPIGKAMALYPVNPRHARMVIAALHSASLMGEKARKGMIVACAVAMAAALSVEDPFVSLEHEEKAEEAENAASSSQPAKVVLKGPNFHRAKFRNTSSDALTLMNALAAYEGSGERTGFCKTAFLNEKIMKEMSKLRVQLLRLVRQQVGCEQDLEEAWKQLSETKLKTSEEKVLLRAICAAWPDRVARRLTRRDKLESQKIHKRGARYQASSLEDVVYLSPSSSTSKLSCDYVVYKEIIDTTRPYMTCITSVDAQCLVSEASYFCTFSKPLEDPPPYYDFEADRVMCWVSPTFGMHNWELPLHSLELKAGKQRTAVFAAALLEGKVLPSLGDLRSYLAADPSMLLKPEAFGQKRVGDLVYRLVQSAVDCRRKLAEAWEGDGMFLYRELESWLQSKHQAALKAVWEAVKAEASTSTEQRKRKR